jgi:hypothetical protein
MSPPNQQSLYDILQDTLININSTSITINLNLYYTFDRPNPEGAKAADKAIVINVMNPMMKNREQVIKSLRDAVDPKAEWDQKDISFVLQDYYTPVIRLTKDLEPDHIAIDELRTAVKFYKHWSMLGDQRKDYWSITQSKYFIDGLEQKTETGIVWITISDKVIPYLLQYSVLTFYISVVLVVGRIMRTSLFEVGSHQIFIKWMSKPDELLLLCEAIHISRLENNTKREEELYFILIDIMRSPEVLKVITGTSIKKIKND